MPRGRRERVKKLWITIVHSNWNNKWTTIKDPRENVVRNFNTNYKYEKHRAHKQSTRTTNQTIFIKLLSHCSLRAFIIIANRNSNKCSKIGIMVEDLSQFVPLTDLRKLLVGGGGDGWRRQVKGKFRKRNLALGNEQNAFGHLNFAHSKFAFWNLNRFSENEMWRSKIQKCAFAKRNLAQ